jgi:hypothetical protein
MVVRTRKWTLNEIKTTPADKRLAKSGFSGQLNIIPCIKFCTGLKV